nr:hAT dimerization domain, ribonuclease H-like domain protein [Tanacetum cinerariifolium]
MKQLEEAYEEKKAESNAKEVVLPCEAGVGFKKIKGSSTPIERAFGVEIRDQLDQEIARMFYTGGLPFNLARNPHYLRAFQFAAANKIDGYVPPGYNKLRTTLLQKENDNVYRQLEPLRSTWKEKGVTICSWIKDVYGDALAIKNFIMNHNMRLSIFSKFTPLRLFSVADTRFASIIVMLKILKLNKTGLQAMVISEEWSSYREDDTVKANFVKEKFVNDEWWDKVSYILSFTRPIYEVIRACDTDKPCLHLMYEMWDSMIEKDSTRSAPHRDAEISQERMKCFRRLFPNDDEHGIVLDEYAMFSMKIKSLRNLKELKIHSIDESPVLEISDVPSLRELRYLPMLFPMTKPPPFDMESLGSVTQLNVEKLGYHKWFTQEVASPYPDSHFQSLLLSSIRLLLSKDVQLRNPANGKQEA